MRPIPYRRRRRRGCRPRAAPGGEASYCQQQSPVRTRAELFYRTSIPPNEFRRSLRATAAACKAALRMAIVQIEPAPEQMHSPGPTETPPLDLRDLMPRRQLELFYGMHQPVDDGFLGRDVDILEAAGDEDFFGDRRALTQDVLGARIIGERGIERTLQALRRHAFLRRHDGRMNHEHGVGRTVTLIRGDE